MSTRAQLPLVDCLVDLGVHEDTLGYVKKCVIGDKTFLVDPWLDEEWAQDGVDTDEILVIPPSGVVSEG